jgi:hypothetical protein
MKKLLYIYIYFFFLRFQDFEISEISKFPRFQDSPREKKDFLFFKFITQQLQFN